MAIAYVEYEDCDVDLGNPFEQANGWNRDIPALRSPDEVSPQLGRTAFDQPSTDSLPAE